MKKISLLISLLLTSSLSAHTSGLPHSHNTEGSVIRWLALVIVGLAGLYFFKRRNNHAK